MNINAQSSNDEGGSLSELAQELGSIDTNAPEAKGNDTSIPDGNGGRIELGNRR